MPVLIDTTSGDDQQERKTFKLLPAGEIMIAEVVECAERQSPFWVDKDNESMGKKQEVNWKFRIIDARFPDYAGRFIWGSTPTTFTTHEHCKLRQWVEEVFATEFEIGFDFELGELVGQDVRVIIGNRTYMKDGQQVTKDFVDSLLRAPTYEDADSSVDPF